MKSIIIGTAGHIDHGKTALTTALTGINPDRLPQEKARGISIELGFAPLRFSDDFVVAIVDVPGHERFVKTMVMGAAQIELVLFVVAANEGMMPQSREHLLILTGLGLKKGIVILSKADLLSEEERLLAAEGVQKELKGTFLEKAPLLFVSAKTLEGIAELKQKIFEETFSGIAARVSPGGEGALPATGPAPFVTPRMWIDRIFTLTGHGTVVTGPLISGQLRVEDELELYPKNKILRIRRIHAYGRELNDVSAPSRIALNIKGVSKEEISRGDVLGKPGTLISTSKATARLKMFPNNIRSVGRYFPSVASATLPARAGKISPRTLNFFSFHVGTTRALVSIKGNGNGISVLKFSKPLVAFPGDRFILRRETTVGAGEIISVNYGGKARKIFDDKRAGGVRRAEGDLLATGPALANIEKSPSGIDVDDLCKKLGKTKREIEPVLKALIENKKIIKLPGGFYIPYSRLEILKSKLKTFFAAHTEMSVGDLKNMFSVSRKLAIPYLQFFDEQKWTIRRGDVRIPWKISD